jgi:hypothetical protein
VSYQNQILAQLENAKDLARTVNTKRQTVNFDDDADDVADAADAADNSADKHDTSPPCTPPKKHVLKIGDSTVFTPKKSVKLLKLGTLSGLRSRIPSSTSHPSNSQSAHATTESPYSDILPSLRQNKDI